MTVYFHSPKLITFLSSRMPSQHLRNSYRVLYVYYQWMSLLNKISHATLVDRQETRQPFSFEGLCRQLNEWSSAAFGFVQKTSANKRLSKQLYQSKCRLILLIGLWIMFRHELFFSRSKKARDAQRRTELRNCEEKRKEARSSFFPGIPLKII